MPFELLTKEELLTAAIATKRPVAFLVGSPLSSKDGVGVPGVTEILDCVRDEIRSQAAFALPRFEAVLSEKLGGDAYQEAMKWLGKNAGQDAINDVVRTAVLRARKAGAAALSAGADGQPDDWNIPPGTASLGVLAARGGEKFLGPILTTNFDPLVSLAIRKSGGRASRRVLSSDGTLAGAAEEEAGICSVVHLHGFWRDSDTLHTQAQLTNPRPRLAKSLQRLLQRRTLIVAAYGGWDDVFTQALVELMNDEQAPLDVIWCFYESDANKVKERYGKLLAGVAPAIVMNRFRAFGGVDCHTIFDEIFSAAQGNTSAVAAGAIESPLAGWEQVNAPLIDALAPLRHDEVIRYFDGATPTWRHAASGDIPRRVAVAEVSRRLEGAQTAKAECSLQLIRAAGGEGKTTLLLQVAAEAAKQGGWNVLWRPTPRISLSPEHVRALDPAKRWLIVADDAENMVRDLGEAARLLHEAGSSHVHFLLAARDADWRYCYGDRQAWGALLKQHPDILLRELGRQDARSLVEAWRKYGSDGLRDLASLSDADKQVAALIEAVRETKSARTEGSFFGGLLSVRFGPEGLQSHVVALLSKLKDARIANSDCTLFDALTYVAACHATGNFGLDARVLADLLGVERDWVQTLVVSPLGEEAAAVRSAEHVLTRHSKVAAAVLVSAEKDFGVDIGEVWSAIVRQTVRTGVDVQMDRHWFSSIIHASTRLHRELPPQFTERRRREIAIAAARADVEAEPSRLCALTDLGRTFRNAGMFEDAIKVFRDGLDVAGGKVDWLTDIRGYWFEWGTCEGFAGDSGDHRAADAWVQGISVSDHLAPAPISMRRIKLGCAGLGVAFGKLAVPGKNCAFAKGRRATVFLGRLSNPDPTTAGYFANHERLANEIETPHVHSVADAVSWLTAAVAQAGREVKAPFLKSFLKPEGVSFNMLREFLDTTHRTTKKHIKQPAARSLPEPPPRLAILSSDFQQRIQSGIERVLKQAWEAVSLETPPGERFSTAKRKASEIIPRLSPHIRRQVWAHFHSTNWEQLHARDPLA